MNIIKNRKIFYPILIILILLIILFIFIFIKLKNIKYNKIIDYFPEEEIAQEQYRLTKIELFFINKNNGEIQSETRIIDVKKLLQSPYELLINMIIEGAKSEQLTSYIPKETKINKIELKNNILSINFSEEFSEINDLENKEKIIEIIKKTLIQLIEVKEIEILF